MSLLQLASGRGLEAGEAREGKEMAKTVVLIGTLDTKGVEFGYVRDKILEQGCHVIVVDVSMLGEPLLERDISREQVAEAGGSKMEEIAALHEGEAVELMAKGAAEVVKDLYRSGKLDGILSLGGSMGTSLATAAMRALPFGVPKVMVSTVAAWDTRPFLGAKDITMIPSIVDIRGLNRITKRMLATAANAIVGMVAGDPGPFASDRPLIGVATRGNLMPCVDVFCDILGGKGYEVVIFHAVGSGGRALEEGIEEGLFAGVFNLVPAEVTDHLFGGFLDAGPDRLETAGRKGIAQILAPGNAMWISFPGVHNIPERFKGRKPYVHNPALAAVRASKDEIALVGRVIAEKLNRAMGPTAVLVPTKGFATRVEEGEEFYDPDADSVLIEALRSHLNSAIGFVEVDAHINDRLFAEKAALLLDELMQKQG